MTSAQIKLLELAKTRLLGNPPDAENACDALELVIEALLMEGRDALDIHADR